MAEEQQEPTAEAIKQRKKREKKAEADAAKGIGVFKVEVAGVFMPDLKRLMKARLQQPAGGVSEPAAQRDRRRLRYRRTDAPVCHDTLRAKRKGVASILWEEHG